jgi:hypothetical protein
VVVRVVVVTTPRVVVRVVVTTTGVVVGARVVVRVVVEVTGPRVVVWTGGVDPSSGMITLCHAKVELIGPHLMSEKATYAFGEFASTSAGLPESREQVPRLTPGADGSASSGN